VFAPLTVEQQPEAPAIDHSGNAWIPIQTATGEIYKVSPTGGTTILTSGTTGANLTWTFGSAIDGNGNVWVVNRCGNYGTCGGGTGINTIIQINAANNLAISPPTNYVPEAQYPATAAAFTKMLDDSLNLAVDPSGNLWVTNYIGNAVVELVGVAAPAITPLSVSAHNNTLGTKP
jgi:streptogramin lyase